MLGEDAENQAAVRRRRVHTLVEAHELAPQRVELAQRVHELAQAGVKGGRSGRNAYGIGEWGGSETEGAIAYPANALRPAEGRCRLCSWV